MPRKKSTSNQNSISPQTALNAWMLECQSRNLSPHSITFYKQQLNQFIGYLSEQGVTRLADVTTAHIRTYQATLQGRGLSSNSLHAAARALRAYFGYCVRDNWINVNPFTGVGMPKVETKLLLGFSQDEVRRLYNAAETQRDRCIVLVLLDTGIRANELLNLDAGDINLQTGTVQVRVTKSKKARLAYLGIRTRKELLRLFAMQTAEADSPVWQNVTTGERLKYDGLRQLLRRLGESAQIKNYGAHRYRRTFAIEFLRNGGNIYALQKLMGHEGLAVLRRYLELVEGDLRDAVDRFGVVDGLFD